MNLAIFKAMSKAINVADLKNNLSEHLDAVEKGEEVIVCRRNVPFARITAIPSARNSTKLGFDRGRIRIRGDITGPALPENEWKALRDDQDF